MSYHGANKVMPNYDVMGPVKAALESSCVTSPSSWGKDIRVHAISPGPLKTRAASGLKGFDLLLNEAAQRAPIGELVDIDDVGMATAYLATPYARRITGTTLYVDGGVDIMARKGPCAGKPILSGRFVLRRCQACYDSLLPLEQPSAVFSNALLPRWPTMGFGAAAEYAADFWQRSLIFLDILRRSGASRQRSLPGRSTLCRSMTTRSS